MTTQSIRLRPIRPSRKKFQEALACLKRAAKTDSLPWRERIRACELIAAIYGVVPVPDLSPNRTRKVIKNLVEESAFEMSVQAEVRENVRKRVIADAEMQARRFLEQEAGTGHGEVTEREE